MPFITPGLTLLPELWSGPGGHRAVWGGWPAIPKEMPGEVSPKECHCCHGLRTGHLRAVHVYFRCSLWKQWRNGEHKRRAFSERLQVTRSVVGTEDPRHQSALKIGVLLLLPSRLAGVRPCSRAAPPGPAPELPPSPPEASGRPRAQGAGSAARRQMALAASRRSHRWSAGTARPGPALAASINSPRESLFIRTQVLFWQIKASARRFPGRAFCLGQRFRLPPQGLLRAPVPLGQTPRPRGVPA